MLLTASIEMPTATRKDIKVNYVIDSNSVDFADAPDNKKRAQIDCMVIAFDSAGKEVAHASDTLDATLPQNAYAAHSRSERWTLRSKFRRRQWHSGRAA